MRASLLILLSLTISVPDSSAADIRTEINRCYSVRTAAEIRETPGQEVTGTLPEGAAIRVKRKGAPGLVLVEYAADSTQNSCPPRGDVKKGWIEEKSLEAYTASLSQLVKEKRVLIVNPSLVVYEKDLQSLLGERTTVKKDEDEIGGILKLAQPLPIKIYCFGNKAYDNTILSARFDYGGDSGVYVLSLKTKSKMPKGDCLIVNGAIRSEGIEAAPGSLQNLPVLCKKSKNKDHFCSERRGTLVENGATYIVVKEGNKGLDGPSDTRWKLYEVDVADKATLLGQIGQSGGP